MAQADFENPLDRFQQNQTIVTSRDTESGGGGGCLSLTIKRAKPNTGSPNSSTEKKSKTKKDANKEKTESVNNQTAAAVATDSNT